MNNEENIKQEWQTPEIVDLNVDKTAGGWTDFSFEATTPMAALS